MTAPRRYGLRSLRFKLVLASVVVEALMLSALVWNSARITDESLQELLKNHVETLLLLMNVSLANPLAQRDYATLEERLGRIVRKESLVYIEVRDELGRIAASRGEAPRTAVFDNTFKVPDHIYDQAFDITLAGRVIGRARYGLDVSALERTVTSLRNQGVLVASAEILLTVLLLATLGALLTRHLLTLARAARALQSGDYSTRVPVVGRDEVTDTAQAFNAMADALARDITERKQAEQVLRDSEERFRATFEQAAVGIAQVAPDGRWLHVNQKLCDIVGYSREELLQRSFQDITHPADLDADLEFVRRMLAGEIQTYGMEKRYIRKDGSLVWIYLTVGLVRQATGEPKYFISVVEDITERKRAEAALRQSEQRSRDLIDGLGPQMFVGLMTPEGTLIEVNHPALAAAGLKPEDVLGKQVEQSYWWSYSEEAQQQLHATVMRAAQGEASRYDAQVRAGENQFIYIDFSLQPLRDDTGRVQYLIGSANVITERKLAEQALRESEERLRLALDAAHMGTFDWDVPANRIAWSRWHEELWGFQPGEFGGTYEAFSERVHPDDLPGINAEVECCIAAREPFVREFRVVWPDGSAHWIAARGEFTFSEAGEAVRMRGAVVEITERKRAEAALREHEEVLRLFVEHSPAAIGMFDKDMRYVAVSRRWLADYSLGDRDIIGRSHYEIFPEIPQRWRDIYRRCLAGATERCDDDSFVRADGHTDWVKWEICPWRKADGAIGGIIVFSEMITERKRAEKALRESEDKYRHILEEMVEGYYEVDLAGNLTFFNPSLSRILGYPAQEMIGANDRLFTDTPTAKYIYQAFNTVFRTGEPTRIEMDILRKDGERRSLSASIQLMRDSAGTPIGFRGLQYDVTDRKRAEDTLRENARQLQTLSKRVLEAQEVERRRLARELHDELGQSLTAIKINLHSRSRLKGPPPDEIDAENLRIVEETLQQVRRLALALRPSMLDDLGLAPALRWMADQAAERGGFTVHFGAEFPDTRLSPELETACFRIAQEALTNIARHAQAQRVAIELRHEGDVLVMTVQDDGRGFDATEAYERAKAGGSTGVLGMQERAALAGGYLEIESSPGQGTTVRARFLWRVREEVV